MLRRARNPLSLLFGASTREQYLAQYVVRECRRGRALADVLDDPYVVNRSTPDGRARLLERPEVVEAIGESAVEELRRTLAGDGPAAGARR